MNVHLDEPPDPILLKIPALPDDIAAALCECLQDFILQFQARYFHQIRRHYQECHRERRELQAQRLFERFQHSPPLGDGPSKDSDIL
jgi:hypothetical protein